jgi:hypothetical protein
VVRDAEPDGELAGALEFGARQRRRDGGGGLDPFGAERPDGGGEQKGRIGPAGEASRSSSALTRSPATPISAVPTPTPTPSAWALAPRAESVVRGVLAPRVESVVRGVA